VFGAGFAGDRGSHPGVDPGSYRGLDGRFGIDPPPPFGPGVRNMPGFRVQRRGWVSGTAPGMGRTGSRELGRMAG
jgi:hypothetical protein